MSITQNIPVFKDLKEFNDLNDIEYEAPIIDCNLNLRIRKLIGIRYYFNRSYDFGFVMNGFHNILKPIFSLT